MYSYSFCIYSEKSGWYAEGTNDSIGVLTHKGLTITDQPFAYDGCNSNYASCLLFL